MRASSTSSGRGVGVYLHVPFCARACPYCDFDFEVCKDPDDSAYLAGLEREFVERADALEAVDVDTIYVGGGTPSTLRGATFGQIFDRLRSRVNHYAPREITVEANPEHVTREWLLELRAAGVTRISLGVQSFSSAGLVTLGRAHRATRALEAMEEIHNVQLEGSADLIIGWPGQSEAALEGDIATLSGTCIAHMSVYALTVESGTPWEKLVARGARAPIDEDTQGDMLAASERLLGAAGYEHYEIASYARSGKQAQHNRKYWRWHDFLGFGPSAASAVATPGGGLERRVNVRGYAAWMGSTPEGRGTLEALSPEAAAREGLWLGLRLLEPLKTTDLEERFLRPPGWVLDRLSRQMELGNVRTTASDCVVVAPDRWLWHDAIAHDLVQGV